MKLCFFISCFHNIFNHLPFYQYILYISEIKQFFGITELENGFEKGKNFITYCLKAFLLDSSEHKTADQGSEIDI